MIEPLNRAFNVAVLQCASRLHPKGFDVIDNAPSSLAELNAYVAKHRRFAVWNGASDRTIFACEETNFAFRAWHDWHHWNLQADFTPDGERAVCAAQWNDLVTLYGPLLLGHRIRPIHSITRKGYSLARLPYLATFKSLLEAEVIGQLQHQQAHGAFPTNQYDFVRSYITLGAAATLQRKW